MKNNIIKEIWDIRGLLDDAIDNQDIDLYDKARNRFVKIFKQEEHLLTVATSTVNFEPKDIEEMSKDREQNFAMIAFSLGNNKKRVQGEEISDKFLQFSCVLELVWYTRGLFDEFFRNLNNDGDEEDRIKLASAIEFNLTQCIEFYENFEDERSTKEVMTLMKLHMAFISKYNDLIAKYRMEQ